MQLQDKTRDRSFCEFFAGIGLVRLGLERAGWHCVYANDNDSKKQEMYEAMFGPDDFHLRDVFDSKAIADRIPQKVKLATASFPCTDLSVAGHYAGIDGKHSSAVFGFLDCITLLDLPEMLLLENVVGLLSSQKGADFERLCRLLAEKGYWLDAFQLDAKYFVPQSRPRVFIVGIHESAFGSCEYERSPTAFELGNRWAQKIGENTLRPKRMVDLMLCTDLPTGWFDCKISEPPVTRGKLIDFIDTDSQQEWWDEVQVTKHYRMMSPSHKEKVDVAIEKGQPWVGTIYRRVRKGSTMAEVRFDGLAGCLRTPKGGSARQIVVAADKHGLRMRWMNAREYARLQGAAEFPPLGKVTQELHGFGDAVCVPVIEWIGNQVLHPIAKVTDLAIRKS